MKNNKGFSLVELIVVIAIMAILAAVAVVSYSIYIERAQDASDMDYITNVLHRVELFALEKGVEVQQVVIAPEVDGAEDIQLIIGWNDDNTPIYYPHEDIKEIYETVGDYTMYGDYDSDGIVIRPVVPEEKPPVGDDSHVHVKGELTDSKASTCTEQGYDKYKCTVTDCSYEFTEYRPLAQHAGEDGEGVQHKNGYKVWQCTTCHNLVIKSDSGNAIVQLPGQKQN